MERQVQKMKKYIIKTLAIFIILQMINTTILSGSTNIKTVEESLDIANKYLEEKY